MGGIVCKTGVKGGRQLGKAQNNVLVYSKKHRQKLLRKLMFLAIYYLFVSAKLVYIKKKVKDYNIF